MFSTRQSAPPQTGRSARLSLVVPGRDSDGTDGAIGALVHRLPSAEETRDAVSGAALRAVDWGRGAFSSARGQLADVSLPEPLQNVSRIGRKPKRRRSRWWMLALIAVGVVGAALAYRWLSGSEEDDDLYAEDWPAEPSNVPGAAGEPREDDRTAELDAEQSLDVRQQTGAPAGVNQP
ncbi:MAG TPA: hypothetical protein VKV26_01280 [Dehalococcoidia bacterium]|nr:hypothetical protein [Dehalococcoidia bacterium]